MNQSSSENTRICGKCHQRLPIDAFYISKKTLKPECYCKQCRGNNNRMSRKMRQHPQLADAPRNYPVVTDIEDREKRIELLCHAWQVVNESMARKRRKLREMEDAGKHNNHQ